MTGSLETYRAVVAPNQCDHLGHMNVQHYFAAVSDGMFAVMCEIGLGPSQIRERKLSFAVVQADSSFQKELVAGDVIRLLSSVEDIGSKSATFLHRMERVEDRARAFETRFKTVLLDLDVRRAAPVPDDLRSALEALRVDAAG